MTKSALKLFVLRYIKGGAIVTENGKPLFFSDKRAAKHKRDPDTMKVSFGPDHNKFQAYKEVL